MPKRRTSWCARLIDMFGAASTERKVAKLGFLCMAATPFGPNGEFDEDAVRQFLHRMLESKLGVYLASGGTGEGHALTSQELSRLYGAGVAECKGKVPVRANMPEQHTVSAILEQARIAIAAGVDEIELYTLEGRHGMRPTDAELEAWLNAVLSEIDYPVALAVSPSVLGYTPKATVIARVCNKFPQVRAVRLHSVPDTYLLDLKTMIVRDIAYYFQFSMGNFNPLAIGVDGLFAVEANTLPKTCRAFVDGYERGDHAATMRAYAALRWFDRYSSQWLPGAARPVKMAMRALKLPGAEGGFRSPYLMPSDEEMNRYTTGLLALGIDEIDELAQNAGLR